MAQVPKKHVHDGFVAAAAQSFAEVGYEATTMAGVAERAGSSVGNLYKYFSSKQQLLAAAVPPELARELRRRTRQRMQAFGGAKEVAELAPAAPYHMLAGELLDYCFAHRSAVVVLLARAEGTPHAGFVAEFVTQLVDWSLEYAHRSYPTLCATDELRFVLRRAYQAFVASIAAALLEFEDEARARAVIALITAQHQGGLKRLFETEGGMDAQPRRSEPSPVVTTAPGSRAGGARSGRSSASATGSAPGKADRSRRPRRRS